MPFGIVGAAIGDAIAGIAAGIGGLAADIGIGAATAGVIGDIGAGALVGAGLGGVTAAISGKPIGEGLLMGALTGGITGGLGSLFSGASGIFSAADSVAGNSATLAVSPVGSAAASGGIDAGTFGTTAAEAAGAATTAGSPLETAANIAGGLGRTDAALGALSQDANINNVGLVYNPSEMSPVSPQTGYGGIGSDAASAGRLTTPSGETSALSPQDAADLQTHLNTAQGDTAPAAATKTAATGNSSTGVLSSLTKFLGFGNSNSDSSSSSGSGGISGSNLALGALSAAGSLFGKSQTTNPSLPGPSSVANGPYFNAPLNTNVPGRTAVNPFPPLAAAQPLPAPSPTATPSGQTPGQAAGVAPNSYWSYGGPEQTSVSGNSLTNMGWPGTPTPNPTQAPMTQLASAPPVNPGVPTGLARGGALNQMRDREFRTGSGNHRVVGPGTETSDDIPARLSNHEYVLDAEDMRKIGGGSPQRGADRLDRDRRNLGRGKGVLAQFAKRRAA